MKKQVILSAILSLTSLFGIASVNDSDRPTAAVISLDSKGLNVDNVSMGSLVRLELEKTERYEVLDKYDCSAMLQEAGVDPSTCFGKNQLVEAGKILSADFMVSGSVEKFGEKIIYTLRLIDVTNERISKTSVIEFIYEPAELQVMTRIVVNDLLDIENDHHLMDLLVNFDSPITSSRSVLNLNGPRIGAQYYTGRFGARLSAPSNEGGYGLSFPMSMTIGYQFETQYITSTDFQALFEFIPVLSGLETGTPGFSFNVLHGVRYKGWEFGIGPSFRLLKISEGYYDTNGDWEIGTEVPEGEEYDIIKNIDSRGKLTLNVGLLVGAGYTFQTGYINIPVNVYFSPSPQIGGGTVGINIGFNRAERKPSN